MKATVYDQNGKEVGNTLLPKEVFGVEANPDLIHQVAVSQLANRRQVITHAKGRAEVRGGGRKPWRQKGTGRARHGSTRSPIWRGGGVTFGPTKERVYKKVVPKKMKRKALLMVLSEKARNNFLVVLDSLKAKEPKTKLMASAFKKLPGEGKNSLIVLSENDKNVILSVRNLPKAGVMQAKDLNALDLLNFKYLIMPKDAIKTIKETFAK